MSPVEGEAHGKNGHPTDVTTAYERFIQLAAEVNADDSLEPEEKKRRLGAIHEQLTKLIHSVTGVPKELIGNKLPHPEAEALRQEFLKEVDNALKSTSMSTEERKSAIGVAGHNSDNLDEAKGASKDGAKHQTHKQMQKTLQSRARADVMSKMKHIMNDASLTQEGQEGAVQPRDEERNSSSAATISETRWRSALHRRSPQKNQACQQEVNSASILRQL
ncbi:hypothetical protein BSL78_15165 [Apostichopus japonicus]|uniref:Uncharacterized protein n=1 Tax=Stichopus japonicus TaxID=307972 RepID=A0A2G8KJ07_STIJA|nr:hypothetical protein BSL78_15165 [Apostichopus japonicus]